MRDEKAFMKEMTYRLNKYEEGIEKWPKDIEMKDCTICKHVFGGCPHDIDECNDCPIVNTCGNKLNPAEMILTDHNNYYFSHITKKDIIKRYKSLIKDLEKAGYTYKEE